jgi:hypothetical protein
MRTPRELLHHTMNQTPESASAPDTFVLAGKNEDGLWRKIETASLEDGETAEDVKTFLQTMAHANSRNYLELDIVTETEFAARSSGEWTAA